MANTYSQLHVHFIFAVKYRACIIDETWEEALHKYIAGIINNYGHKLLAINGTSDHIHILIGKKPTQSESDLMEQIKGSSSKWINEQKFTKYKFSWQSGFGAFSHTREAVPNVITYIENQKEHHKKVTFIDEYRAFLKKYDLPFEEKYIFQALE